MTAPSLPSLSGARGAALIRADLLRARMLSVLRGVLADEVGVAFLDLLEALATEESPARIGGVYGRLFALLADEAELSAEPLVGDAWQNHLLDRPGDRDAVQPQGPAVRRRRARLAAGPGPARPRGPPGYPRPGRPAPRPRRRPRRQRRAERRLGALGPLPAARRRRRASSPRPASPSRSGSPPPKAALAEALAEHYARIGAAPFGRYRAFRWVREGARHGHLVGIAAPDPIRLDQLVGYDRERALVLQNTEQFLAGFPANSVLLYGDRGTGKSSTVKALLNEHAGRGLRLVEVSRDDLGDFPWIIQQLRDRPERFILFVDDLSFDESERDYRGLKAVLEGASRPAPATSCSTPPPTAATWSRSAGPTASRLSAEVHGQDTMQEKLSLSDRFGIRVVFPSRTSGATWRSSSRWLPSAASPSIPRCCADGRCSGPSGTTAGAAHRAPVRRPPGRRAGDGLARRPLTAPLRAGVDRDVARAGREWLAPPARPAVAEAQAGKLRHQVQLARPGVPRGAG